MPRSLPPVADAPPNFASGLRGRCLSPPTLRRRRAGDTVSAMPGVAVIATTAHDASEVIRALAAEQSASEEGDHSPLVFDRVGRESARVRRVGHLPQHRSPARPLVVLAVHLLLIALPGRDQKSRAGRGPGDEVTER